MTNNAEKGNAPEVVKRELTKLLERFQEGYAKRDTALIDSFMNELFAREDDIIIIGTGDEEWCLGFDGAKEIIESDWKYWGNVKLNFDNLEISSEGNTAWLYTDAVVKANPGGKERHLNRLLDSIKEIASKDEPAKERLMKIVREGAWSLLQLDKDGELEWPFQFTALAVNRGDKWIFHHMQFSFPTVMPGDVRYNDILKIVHKQLKEGNAPESTQNEIRKVLKAFQNGYTKRDLTVLNEFMEELFVKDEDILIVGTGYNEIRRGFDGAKELIESDWKYWWDAVFDIDGAMISSYENTAWVTAEAYISKEIAPEDYYSGLLEELKADMESSMEIRGKVIHALEGTASTLYETSISNRYFRPIRFTSVLVRRDGLWKFKQMQFSFPTKMLPDVRMIGDKAYAGYIECNW